MNILDDRLEKHIAVAWKQIKLQEFLDEIDSEHDDPILRCLDDYNRVNRFYVRRRDRLISLRDGYEIRRDKLPARSDDWIDLTAKRNKVQDRLTTTSRLFGSYLDSHTDLMKGFWYDQ